MNEDTQQPDPSSTPPEHKRAKRGWAGLATCSKERTFDGENSKLENALYNDYDSTLGSISEKPIHRVMCDYSLRGYTNIEIGMLLGRTSVNISHILRQPWARQYMIDKSAQGIKTELEDFLKAEVMPSLKVVRDIRDSDTTRPETKVLAANVLLDRLLGKPTQPIIQENISPEKLTDTDLERIATTGTRN